MCVFCSIFKFILGYVLKILADNLENWGSHLLTFEEWIEHMHKIDMYVQNGGLGLVLATSCCGGNCTAAGVWVGVKVV